VLAGKMRQFDFGCTMAFGDSPAQF